MKIAGDWYTAIATRSHAVVEIAKRSATIHQPSRILLPSLNALKDLELNLF